MNSTSRYALVAALGLAVVAIAPGAPAFAAKKEEAAASGPKLSDAVRKPLAEADAAIKKKDIAAADTAIATARAAASSADEQYVVAQFAFNAAQASGDQARIEKALDDLLSTGVASNRLAQAEQAKMYWYQGQFAYQAKNYPKAEQALKAAIAAGTTEDQAYAVLADSQARTGKPNEAVATLQKVIDAKAASGQAVPTEWYARGADIASRAKLTNDFVKITTSWLQAYPVKQNWHDTLFIYRQLTAQTGDADLDLLRLARAVGVLPLSAQSNYTDYALAVYLKFPNEAVDVLNEGIAAGKLNAATSKNTREIIDLSKPKIAADKASLPAAVTAASGPKGTFKSALTTGDLAYGYKDYAKAAEMYKLALTKPGADASQANFHLGLALAQSGDKEGAKAAFTAASSGSYAVLAGYGKVWVDRPAS